MLGRNELIDLFDGGGKGDVYFWFSFLFGKGVTCLETP